MEEPPSVKSTCEENSVKVSTKRSATEAELEDGQEKTVENAQDLVQAKKLKVEEVVPNHEQIIVSKPDSEAVIQPEKKEESPASKFGTLVADHYNAVPEVGLAYRTQSRIFYMRNFNNWIKSQLIDEYLEKIKQSKGYQEPIKILDMCCGKGGDLLKWEKGKVRHVICVDIAGVSIEQCKSRYESMKRPNDQRSTIFSGEFLTFDCTKVRLREKYRDPTIKLDLVSCQFAFHYCFESLPQAECMLRNASEVLEAGKFFIGTIPNANELVARWRKAEGNTFGNDIYNIEFMCDKENPPLFGAKYHFSLEGVVNCPEFLVHPKVFEKLALKFGLKLIMFKPFVDFYEQTKDLGRSLLARMKALEGYPPLPDTPLKGNSSTDYQHAIQYKENHPNVERIGTISKSEWEAITLYVVFAFKKLKHKWNAEGKAEYILED